MSDFEKKESTPVPSAPAATPGHVDTAATVSAIQALLSSETITDPTDKRNLEAATSFLASLTGTEALADISKHGSAVAEVMSGYEMQGNDVPPEIDAVYLKLTVLQCQFHIDVVQAEMRQASPDKAKMQHPMKLALDIAKILAKGYKDDSKLQEVQALQSQIDRL